MGRLNQLIEAFVHYILGSQVNVRLSILGSSGSIKEVQREFLVLVEDTIECQRSQGVFKGFSLKLMRLKSDSHNQNPCIFHEEADHWSNSPENEVNFEPMRPGRIPVILLQRVLKPFPTPFTTNVRPYVSALTITSIIVLTGSTTAETVDPYYLKMFPTLS